MKKFILFLSFFLLSGLAHADLGPKPELFIRLNVAQDIGQQSAELLQCQQESCADAKPLGMVGPQHFQCCLNACYAMSYGFSPYAQLRFTKDGKVLTSKVFKTASMMNYFTATFAGNDLTLAAASPFDPKLNEQVRYCSASTYSDVKTFKESKPTNAYSVGEGQGNISGLITSDVPCSGNDDCDIGCHKGGEQMNCLSKKEIAPLTIKSNAMGAVQNEITHVCLSDAYFYTMQQCGCLPQSKRCGIMSPKYLEYARGRVEWP